MYFDLHDISLAQIAVIASLAGFCFVTGEVLATGLWRMVKQVATRNRVVARVRTQSRRPREIA